jgi:hypothetical protein
VPSTSVAAGTLVDSVEVLTVLLAELEATGASLVPVTVIVTVLAVLTPPSLSVAV